MRQARPRSEGAGMADDFKYDVLLSHSAKDKAVVRPLAERLRADGLRVWFDEWELKPGDSIPAKIEEGLEHSQFPIHPSAFILQPFFDGSIKGSLAQFFYINWLPADREQEYAKTLGVGRQRKCKIDSSRWELIESRKRKLLT
jgi:hypothetical protein